MVWGRAWYGARLGVMLPHSAVGLWWELQEIECGQEQSLTSGLSCRAFWAASCEPQPAVQRYRVLQGIMHPYRLLCVPVGPLLVPMCLYGVSLVLYGSCGSPPPTGHQRGPTPRNLALAKDKEETKRRRWGWAIRRPEIAPSLPPCQQCKVADMVCSRDPQGPLELHCSP